MRRRDKLVSDKNLLHTVLDQAKVCRLGLANGTHPYIVPMSFGFDGRDIYIHSATSGEKIEILRNNPNVCVEFEQDVSIVEGEKPCHWGVQYLTVIGHGTAEPVTDPAQKSYGLNQIFRHYQPMTKDYPFASEELESVLIYKITLREIVGKISGSKLRQLYAQTVTDAF